MLCGHETGEADKVEARGSRRGGVFFTTRSTLQCIVDSRRDSIRIVPTPFTPIHLSRLKRILQVPAECRGRKPWWSGNAPVISPRTRLSLHSTMLHHRRPCTNTAGNRRKRKLKGDITAPDVQQRALVESNRPFSSRFEPVFPALLLRRIA